MQLFSRQQQQIDKKNEENICMFVHIFLVFAWGIVHL